MSIRKGNDIIASKPLVDAVPTQDSTNAVSSGGVYDVIQKITRGGFYHPDMFDWKWADHQLNDVQWLRADTFSWQSGAVYEAAFWDLFYDIQISTYWYSSGGPGYTKSRTPAVGDAVYLNSDLTTQIGTVDSYDDVNDEITVSGDTYSYMSNTYVTPTTETVAGYSLSVYTGHSGRKIVSAGDETNVANIYTATGVAWYYIIDIPNKRFKLPRTKFGVTGLRDTVGNYVEPGLPNITGHIPTPIMAAYGTTGGAFYSDGNSNTGLGAGNHLSYGMNFDASRSSSIYGNSTTVQAPATQMYLYFYVGEFTQTAIENTAGLNAELFNNKVDVGHEVIAFQAPTSANNYTWYRKYRDGWVEQGGIASTNGGNPTPITLPVEMVDAGYVPFIQGKTASDGYSGATWQVMPVDTATSRQTSTQFYAQGSITGYNLGFSWRVEGMAA